MSAHRGSVVEPAVCGAFGKADHGRAPCGRGRDPLESDPAVVDETSFQNEVLGRIPADRELAEHRQLGATIGGAPKRRDDVVPVGFEVADGRIQLTERDPYRRHGGILRSGPGSGRFELHVLRAEAVRYERAPSNTCS